MLLAVLAAVQVCHGVGVAGTLAIYKYNNMLHHALSWHVHFPASCRLKHRLAGLQAKLGYQNVRSFQHSILAMLHKQVDITPRLQNFGNCMPQRQVGTITECQHPVRTAGQDLDLFERAGLQYLEASNLQILWCGIGDGFLDL